MKRTKIRRFFPDPFDTTTWPKFDEILKIYYFKAFAHLDLRTNNVTWIRIYKQGEEISLHQVKHLQQDMDTLGSPEIKGIGALTDGEPIDEANALDAVF